MKIEVRAAVPDLVVPGWQDRHHVTVRWVVAVVAVSVVEAVAGRRAMVLAADFPLNLPALFFAPHFLAVLLRLRPGTLFLVPIVVAAVAVGPCRSGAGKRQDEGGAGGHDSEAAPTTAPVTAPTAAPSAMRPGGETTAPMTAPVAAPTAVSRPGAGIGTTS
jgi:hypothetical protein